MWKTPWRIKDINKVIDQVVSEVTSRCLKIKETHTTFTESLKYLYNCLSGFVSLGKVEYVESNGTRDTISDCEVVWDELVDTDVTATLDNTFYKVGSGSLKLVVAAGCGAGDILATDSLTSLDISDCNEVQIWIYSTVALDAGDLQLLLGNTASCASAVESLNIPATTANTWTRHIISLANPYSDTAIISVGLKMVTDKGAFTLWADDIIAQDNFSNTYKLLSKEYWSIYKASTPYLKLTSDGLAIAGENAQLKLTGYQIPALMDSDDDTSDIDPAYVIKKSTGDLLINHAKSSSLDIEDRARIGSLRLQEANMLLSNVTTNLEDTVEC
jgi:hypothetical protein